MSENASSEAQNLMSSLPASDASLRPTLHPLVLLTISDYITRHTLRGQKQPIVGALLGQQNGREVSIEYAFEARLETAPPRSDDVLDAHWFDERLKQYKEVHKVPALDLVGWWTLCPEQGPLPSMLPYHKYLMHEYNESLLLLGFHPQVVLGQHTAGGKLPLTIYESIYEKVKDDGKAMQIDGEENADGEEGTETKFRALAYEVVTGEAEMIGIDFVAKGGGNAVAVNQEDRLTNGRGTGISNEGRPDTATGDLTKLTAEEHAESSLSAEDEEHIASLMTRANAIKMLHARLIQLQEYLEGLPPSYLTDDSLPAGVVPEHSPDGSPFSFSMVRSIQALTSRLSLLIPADHEAFQRESQAEKSEVALVSLLGELGRSVQQAKELGGKWSVVDAARTTGLRDMRSRWGGEEMMLSERADRDW